MSTTTTTDWNDAVAKVMAESCASKEAAEEALHESGGDVDGAILLLLNETFKSPTKPPPPRMDSGPTFIDDAPSVAAFDRKMNCIDDDDDDAVAKSRETPMYAPPLSASAATTTKESDDITENEDGQENQHHDDTVSGEGAASIESPPSSSNNIITSNDTATSSIRVRAQMPPRQTQPGAVRVAAFDPEDQNDSTFSVTTTTVESGRGNTDSEDLISAQLVGDIPEAEVVEEKQQCSTRVKIWIGVSVVLAMTVAVVLGTVLTREQDGMQPTEAPTPSPQEILKELESLLIPVSFDNGTALQEQSTPQNNALNWLANNTNLDTYSDAKKFQRYSLATLFYSTNGTSWYQKSNWRSNIDECDWGYVFCDENHSLETLELSDNNLFGTIPNELALLSNLSALDLSSNGLTGTIPNELALMSNLSALDLYDNSLNGTIPSQIALMSKLTYLDLSGNRLNGTIPSEVELLTKLTWLLLNSNGLTGTIPSQIGLLSNLYTLALSSNSLRGKIPSQIALMSNLTYLDLVSNSLTGTIPSQIGLLSNLSGLDISFNSLRGKIPSQIALMLNLTELSLWHNSLMGTIPSQLGSLTKLKVLELSGNSLTGTIPSQIALMSNLDFLLLYNNNFTGEFTCPAFIDDCWISCDWFTDTYTEACRSL
jgi:Leucine-rich repeat (LRR) protein